MFEELVLILGDFLGVAFLKFFDNYSALSNYF
jgi:hypothetical protein